MRNQLILFFLTLIITTATTFGQPLKDTVVDIDGNVYHTVKIGTQTWMVENLKVTHYRNRDAIPIVTDSMQWSELITDGYCNYNNDINISKTYGRLYNWYAVNNSGNIAPKGWHVPSDAEWEKLTNYLGIEGAGSKLKETGINHWLSTSPEVTNETGFTALPGGYRGYEGAFIDIGNYGYWWSSTEDGSEGSIWSRYIGRRYNNIVKSNYNKGRGFSVRCVKDN